VNFHDARELLRHGVATRAFPAAAIEVGRGSGVVWQEAFGHLTYEAGAPACTVQTIFDLASLTKVIATTTLAMRHDAAGTIGLDEKVSEVFPAWQGPERDPITIRQLLDHSSGLPAHVRFWETGRDRADLVRDLIALIPDRPIGASAVYSDPGFILLGLVLEHAGHATLDDQFDRWTGRAMPGTSLMFEPPAALRERIAPTEIDPWRGRLLQGEVHDENAALLGGVAAHAGLFGAVGSIGEFARIVLATFRGDTPLGTPALMRTFAARSHVAASSRALGWDTMLPTSSCGTLMSPTAIGHTGFTGTSVWIDHERDVYVALLTNRVHPTRANQALPALRPLLHDAVMKEIS